MDDVVNHEQGNEGKEKAYRDKSDLSQKGQGSIHATLPVAKSDYDNDLDDYHRDPRQRRPPGGNHRSSDHKHHHAGGNTKEL